MMATSVKAMLRRGSAYAGERLLCDVVVLVLVVGAGFAALPASIVWLPRSYLAVVVAVAVFGLLVRMVAHAVFDLADAAIRQSTAPAASAGK